MKTRIYAAPAVKGLNLTSDIKSIFAQINPLSSLVEPTHHKTVIFKKYWLNP